MWGIIGPRLGVPSFLTGFSRVAGVQKFLQRTTCATFFTRSTVTSKATGYKLKTHGGCSKRMRISKSGRIKVKTKSKRANRSTMYLAEGRTNNHGIRAHVRRMQPYAVSNRFIEVS
eukprot:TRINITY_DN3647_c1_g1_i1.p1 TRINITY_DN3647_c1_g1~~TRINITY_DN3647_c1_g1_i1.p1  ORF type:complete len:130 (+),score=13.23 TRINITY_DN3647_c1_g1_i1:44-391(+)